ncbi:CFEM domain-containing protein [Hirsutella rhossiliensis]|uniref:CFEM domain-containing protein n=1 Tax=Hirsutella rhossiliensis TaxID=111463 RepID=A0A9P8N524_9HYPO|nr:CFEM domain-containing protein [Hirsutella rhossiliensis]KAH0967112.1 CFEM domain-containing protein [Hirsutella rhossiliensis]
MKSAVFALSALVAGVAAQNSLTPCLQGCSNRMRSAVKAQELSCTKDDLKCLCSKPGFMYGYRDCAAQACTQDDGKQLIDMAVKSCRDAGVVIAPGGSGGSGGASSTGGESSPSGGQATVQTIYSTMMSDGTVLSTPIATQTVGDDGDGGGDSNSAGGPGGAGGAIVTTITSNGSEIVSTITAMSPGGSSGSGGAPATNTASSASTTQSDNTSPTTGSPSSGNGGSGASPTGSSASSSSSAGFAAPQVTAAPAAGLFAVAGIAALLI